MTSSPDVITALLRMRWLMAAANVETRLAIFAQAVKANFNPDQPRVPAGNPDGGRWTQEGEPGAVQLAANTPRLGPAARIAIALQLALQAIEAYRRSEGLFDLFGTKEGTIAVTTINGKDIFGANSNSPTYTTMDRVAADGMRDTLLEKYPEVMDTDNIGRRPNDALFHAETTVLLRAARENGGTLEGKTLEVYVDRAICLSCKIVLPLIGRELGNPTVTVLEPTGERKLMKNGVWMK
jgi:hypothetical protein